METLTFEIPDEPSNYFLEFSSKEEYLRKRDEWRQLYKWLSKTIRQNKKVSKAYQSAFTKIRDRMAKKGWSYYPSIKSEDYLKGFSEYETRARNARHNLPKGVSERSLDPTEMLRVRREMKEESRRQREKVVKP